ncbi:MAG: YggS family pyridoxal phosphate-dependent enzyme [Flavobacteriaceae bacterium]|nr:YggS family pyridoxal phosphate-dependent enzyme [Flavobacteriaceae bacterium]
MIIKQNLINFKKGLPDQIELVAVSKTKPISDIQEAYDAGHKVFGENKVQEMVNKYEELPKDIAWHMIGHLQRNKVKYMAHFVHLIHGVDSLKTLIEINKQAKKHERVIQCLLQARIAQEETKFGLQFEEIENIIKSQEFVALKNIKIIGLMGMASFSDDEIQVASEFDSLKTFFDKLKNKQLSTFNFQLSTLSMGMSGDYKIAIKNGSNMVRVGSAIFGARNYIA